MIMVMIITSNMRSSMCRSWSWSSSSQAAWGAACADQDGQEAVKRDRRLPLDKLSHKLYLVFYYAFAVTQALLAKYSSSWFSTILSSLKQTLTQAVLAKYSSAWFFLLYFILWNKLPHKLYLVFYYAVFLESHSLTQAVLAKYSSTWCFTILSSLNLTVSHKLYLLVLYFLQHPQAILGFPPQPPLLVVSNSHTNCTR